MGEREGVRKRKGNAGKGRRGEEGGKEGNSEQLRCYLPDTK